MWCDSTPVKLVHTREDCNEKGERMKEWIKWRKANICSRIFLQNHSVIIISMMCNQNLYFLAIFPFFNTSLWNWSLWFYVLLNLNNLIPCFCSSSRMYWNLQEEWHIFWYDKHVSHILVLLLHHMVRYICLGFCHHYRNPNPSPFIIKITVLPTVVHDTLFLAVHSFTVTLFFFAN